MTLDRRVPRHVVVTIAAMVLVFVAFVLIYLARRDLFFPLEDRRAAQPDDRASMLRRGEPIRFLNPQPIGNPFTAKQRPLVAHVTMVDLDADGLLDIVACDVLANRVVWIRQFPRGTFAETSLGTDVRAPAHAEAVDLDRDGDLDLVVASLGVMFPSNAKIGSVVVLENDGREKFTNRVLVDQIARVSDVRAGDLDGDGDLDLAVAQFGYDDGETRWMENLGNWRFKSTGLQNLSGPINVEIVDLDGDGDLDIASLVSRSGKKCTGS